MAIWVMIANSSFAEIYSVDRKSAEIILLEHLDYPTGRKKGSEVFSDRPGRGFQSGGTNRHALSSEIDWHSHEQQIFAHQLSELLRKGHEKGSFVQLVLIAPPQFLGEIRKTIPEQVKSLLKKELAKDIPSSLPPNERIEAIRKVLELKRPVSPSAWESK